MISETYSFKDPFSKASKKSENAWRYIKCLKFFWAHTKPGHDCVVVVNTIR